MEGTKLDAKGRITLPRWVRSLACLEPGLEFDVEIVGDHIELRPKREEGEMPPDQAWFFTPEWQAAEREADEDIVAGRGKIYHSDEEFLEALERDFK